jgi:hypothetical protein
MQLLSNQYTFYDFSFVLGLSSDGLFFYKKT